MKVVFLEFAVWLISIYTRTPRKEISAVDGSSGSAGGKQICVHCMEAPANS